MFASSLRALAVMDSAIGAVSLLNVSCAARPLSYFDAAFNMTDEMFNGVYFGKNRHPPDMHRVLQRASQCNVTHMLATPGSLSQLKETLHIARAHPYIFVTAGVHPTRCREFEADGSSADEYLAELKALIQSHESKIVAVGECGLDYARTEFCDKETQMKYFLRQLQVCALRPAVCA
jgi:TatD DNase family protein